MSKININRLSRHINLRRFRLRLSQKSSRLITIGRWWIVGLFFTGINVPLLYVFVDILKFPLAIASFVAAELSIIFRFFLNDRWVFGHRRPTWRRFNQYHVASVSSFILWWIATNLMAYLGVNYLLASVIASAISVMWSMVTNFLWIWKSKNQKNRQTTKF